VRAVQDRAVFKAPPWSTWSPRLAPVALWMAASAYPDAFAGTEVAKRIDRFYRDVYGIPYEKVRPIEN
jgi:iron complex transport system substrate-binding protein